MSSLIQDYKDCAAVYVATGTRFVEEAIQSATSLRTQMPDLKIILHTEQPIDLTVFNQIEKVENPSFSFIDKTYCYKNVTEDRVLFLDTDTYIVQPLFEIFDLLKRFSVVACHAPWRLSWDKISRQPWTLEGIPEAFSEPNTGVIGFRNEPAVHGMLERWRELYAIHQQAGAVMHDQPAFRQAIWESGLSIYMMPPEWNSRLIFPTFLNGPVKVIHSRMKEMPKVAEEINARRGNRIFDPNTGRILHEATFRKLSKGIRKQLFKLLR